MNTGTIKIEAHEEPGKVRVRTDKPGERATSAVVDGKEFISEIAGMLGITVSFTEPAEEPVEEPVEEPAVEPVEPVEEPPVEEPAEN